MGQRKDAAEVVNLTGRRQTLRLFDVLNIQHCSTEPVPVFTKIDQKQFDQTRFPKVPTNRLPVKCRWFREERVCCRVHFRPDSLWLTKSVAHRMSRQTSLPDSFVASRTNGSKRLNRRPGFLIQVSDPSFRPRFGLIQYLYSRGDCCYTETEPHEMRLDWPALFG